MISSREETPRASPEFTSLSQVHRPYSISNSNVCSLASQPQLSRPWKSSLRLERTLALPASCTNTFLLCKESIVIVTTTSHITKDHFKNTSLRFPNRIVFRFRFNFVSSSRLCLPYHFQSSKFVVKHQESIGPPGAFQANPCSLAGPFGCLTGLAFVISIDAFGGCCPISPPTGLGACSIVVAENPIPGGGGGGCIIDCCGRGGGVSEC